MAKCTLFLEGKEREATLGSDGYMYFWLPDGSSIKAHRAIVEACLGRKLRPDEEVHHIDGDRANNNLSNLAVMSKGEHSRLHRIKEHRSGKQMFGNHNEQVKRRVIGTSEHGEIVLFESLQDARRAGFSHVVDCCKGKRKTDKGYRWSYVDK